MRVIDSIDELKTTVRLLKNEGKTIGLIPTMGYLHEGHISLVKASRHNNDITIMSIFVNPAQFGPNEDFEKYPRDVAGDSRKADEAGVDILFIPSVNEMYPDSYSTYIEVLGITDRLCGKSRQGHFKGVCTVVLKLFNIVEPDRAYFGQKDAQQAAVIKKMVKDLNSTVWITVCPIVRESDGLAMSSRNVYLNKEERKAALVLSKSLMEAVDLTANGEADCERLRDRLISIIGGEKLADIDYVEILDAETLEFKEILKGRMLVAVAVRFGKTRLIDNVVVEVN
ncbi:MAG: pantoate--beta-alanine ligase [Ruminiclostridium sp.]|nr:pantoate--beta-alanine ligase [Ruminiclostridium sp.]